jgi:hypothetical protein
MGITHAKVSAKSDGGDATLVLPSDWNDDHVITDYRPPTQTIGSVTGGASIAPVFTSTPASDCILYAQTASVATAKNVSSIVQTNVTWTQVTYGNDGGNNSKVELWKGVPTGTPGTTVTVTWSAVSNNAAVITEWPAAYSISGTLDQQSGITATGTQPYAGPITTAADALVFATEGNNNGTIPASLISPYQSGVHPFTQTLGQSFFAFGYMWVESSVGHTVSVYVPVVTSSVWVVILVSVT